MNHPSIPVADQNGKSIPSDVRTSLGTFIPRSYDKIVDRIEKRVAEVTQLPASESWTSWIGESRVLLSLDCGSFTLSRAPQLFLSSKVTKRAFKSCGTERASGTSLILTGSMMR